MKNERNSKRPGKLRTSIAFLSFFILLSSFFIPFQGNAWGFWAHRRINRVAVFTLPKEMLLFYKTHIEYLTEHAVDPDKRRYVDSTEAPRHYIDLDHYDTYPFDTLPRKWDDAAVRFTADTLNKYGTVPWHIRRVYYQLVDAFRQKDTAAILRPSADLGHYVGDAHVPLHTTENYDGQLTGQKGIHSFWESRVPELLGNDYNYFVGKARYIPNVQDIVWESVLQSSLGLDSVLRFEKELTRTTPEDKKYAYVQRGKATVRTYSDDFTRAYSDRLRGQVERRMRASIYTLGCLWMSAWADAGQPDLNKLVSRKPSKHIRKALQSEEQDYLQGRWKGRPE